MIASLRPIGSSASHAGSRSHGAASTGALGHDERVEPVSGAHTQHERSPRDPNEAGRPISERRASEHLANAGALRLGIAAQMLTSHHFFDQANVLPLPPATRGAARYATTAEGADRAARMGFSRAV